MTYVLFLLACLHGSCWDRAPELYRGPYQSQRLCLAAGIELLGRIDADVAQVICMPTQEATR